MKKVFLSLLLAIACMPVAFSQSKGGDVLITDTAVCGTFTWDVNNVNYTHDTAVVVSTDTAIYVLNLHVSHITYDTLVAIDLDSNCFVEWNGKRYVDAGTRFDTILSASGCDTIVKLNINLVIPHPVVTDTTAEAGCSYNWGGTIITDTLPHTHTFITTEGCDSIVRLRVTFSGIENIARDLVVCDRYINGNDTITTDTNLVVTSVADNCTTNDTIHLTIAHSAADTTVIDTIGGCDIVWGGRTYRYTDIGAIAYENVRTAYKCDSVVGIHIVAFDSTKYEVIYDSNSCKEYSFTYQTINSNGRTSNHTVTFDKDSVYTTAPNGDPLMTYSSARKCKTFHTIHLTLNQPAKFYRADIVDTVCDRFILSFNNTINNPDYAPITFTQTIDDTIVSPVHVSAANCYDSIVRVNLVINHKSYDTTRVENCDTYTWPVNNTVYTHNDSTEVINSVKNMYGCDSVSKLYVTIHKTPEAHIEGVFDMEPPYESTTLKAIYEGTERVSYKWYVNNILQASVADSLVIDRPTEANPHNKNVRLETTSQYNCTGTSWVTVTYNVGIDDVDALKVSVYPNPASRYLNLESAEGISNVTVYNALGQQVIARSVNAENVQLDLSSLAIGNYTLRIVSLNGKESTRKFIVNK